MLVTTSYRHQDPESALAHTFAEALEQAGHQVFIDTDVRWGAYWVKAIQEALERSDYLLVLLSSEAAKSEMIVEEIEIARRLAHAQGGRPAILPIRVRYPFTEELPYPISAHLRLIQQEQWESDDDTSRLIDNLLVIVANQTDWSSDTVRPSHSGSVQKLAPRPHFDPRDIITTPGGAIDPRFYIERDADQAVLSAVHQPRAMVTVRGARQTGKTSLIMNIYATLRDAEREFRIAFVDFQAFPHDDFQSLNMIWRVIANEIAEQLQLDEWDGTSWQLDGNHDRQLSRFLDHYVFNDDKTPLLICLDEVDRVFSSPIKSDFFGLLRAFHNRGAIDPTWKHVRWLLGTSSEPSFFIEDLTQSPFNIGLRVELNAFTADEVATFAERHGLKLESEMLNRIMTYVGGRPYLVHLLLYHWLHKPELSEQFFDASTAGGGIFRDNLHRYLMQFQQEEVLASAMKSVVAGLDCRDVRLLERLEAAGLVRRDENQKVVPFCQLYAEFFKKGYWRLRRPSCVRNRDMRSRNCYCST